MAVSIPPNILRFALLYGAFWIFTFFEDYRGVNVFLQFLTIGTAAVVLWTYRWMALYSLFGRESSEEDHLVLGITCAWLGVLLRSATIIIWRTGWFGNDPQDSVDFQILNSFNWMIVLGGVLHATAPKTISGRVPAVNWRRLAYGGVSSIAIWAAFVFGPFNYQG